MVALFAFLFTDTPPTQIYTLSLHDALPISARGLARLAAAVEDCGASVHRHTRSSDDASGAAALQRYATPDEPPVPGADPDRKSTRLNSSHVRISYAVFCLKKKKKEHQPTHR